MIRQLAMLGSPRVKAPFELIPSFGKIILLKRPGALFDVKAQMNSPVTVQGRQSPGIDHCVRITLLTACTTCMPSLGQES